MEWNPGCGRFAAIGLLLAVGALVFGNGCTGFVSAMLYKGRIAPAACNALVGKRVAVVCVGDSGDFGPNPNAGLLARRVGRLLRQNVKKIDVVNPQEIDAWMDEHDVDFVDYAAIGKGVKADLVVAIDLESLRLQDNATLYKGRADYRLRVIDVAGGGREIYAPFAPPTVYPRISGLHTASVSQDQFRQKFIDVLAKDIAIHFYEHDLNEQIAIDTPDL